MSKSEIFITGANGQLGLALRDRYPEAKYADKSELDITNCESVANYDWSNINTIINTAAYTQVDLAETAQGRLDAWQTNATALSYLADIALKNNITLVHVSSDYVFDGSNHIHTEDEALSPLSVYGASKAAGDLIVNTLEQHYTLRTSWVIGEGKNFVNTMINLAEKGISPTVVSDQIGRLTFTSELVRAIDHLLVEKTPFGTYNLSNSGESVSWAEITREIFKNLNGTDLTVTDITTEEYYKGKTEIAPRPLQSTLDLSKIQATGFESRDWRDDLTKYVNSTYAKPHLFPTVSTTK